MQTLKIKYKSDNIDIIKKYIQQYNSVYRVAYNKLNNSEHVSYKILLKLNNIELLDSWFILSALTDAKTLLSIIGKGNRKFKLSYNLTSVILKLKDKK